MAQPPAYNPTYNFSTEVNYDGTKFQTNNMEIKASIDGVLTNLAIIQSDDGKIANGSVSYDALDSDVLTLINTNLSPTFSATISAVDTKVDQNTASITALDMSTTASIAGVNSSIAALTANIATLTSDLAALAARVTTLETNGVSTTITYQQSANQVLSQLGSVAGTIYPQNIMPNASTGGAGLMTAADKVKLDGL